MSERPSLASENEGVSRTLPTLVAPVRGERVPAVALWLGAVGVIPFLAGTLLAWTETSVFGQSPARLVISYGAVILSFLGGMVWGLSSAALARDPVDGDAAKLMAASVVPSLIAWPSLFLPEVAALITLAAMFAIALGLDRAVWRAGFAPGWWMKLRRRLSTVVIIALAGTALSFVAT